MPSLSTSGRPFAAAGPFMCSRRTPGALILALALAFGAAAAGAAPKVPPAPRMELYAYELEHQRADEAFAVVQPLLSSSGTLELRPKDNTLVIRDTRATLGKVVAALRAFDHPSRDLEIEVTMVQATRASFSPLLADQALSPELASRLKLMLPFSNYRVLATTLLHAREGEEVTYEIGEGFSVRFRTGVVRPGVGGEGHQMLKLNGFRLSREGGGAPKSLLSTTMSLQLDKPMALTLAGSEASSTALVVVLEPRLDGN